MGASNWPGLRFPKGEPRARRVKREQRTSAEHEREVFAAVDKRDGQRCQLSGKRADPHKPDRLGRLHHHHIEQKGRDLGPTETWNLVSVCTDAHDLIHENRLTVTGNADEQLIWTIERSAVVEVFGRRRVPERTARGHVVLVVDDDDWPAYIRGAARHR